MKIAWLTPLSKRTGISRYSLSAVRALSKRIHIDVWTEKKTDDYSIPDMPVYEIKEDVDTIKKLKTYDAVIYNIGNNLEFHKKIFEVSKAVKGIVILHDKIMQHFVASYWLEEKKAFPRYLEIMEYYYGQPGKEAAVRSFKGSVPLWETADVSDYPLYEPFLYNAIGVVVHSKDAYEMVSHRYALPVQWVNHPFSLNYLEYGNKPLLNRSALKLPEGKIIALSYGHINKTKRIENVLQAIADSPDIQRSLYYVIAGTCHPDYLHALKEKVISCGLDGIVRFTGHIDDHTLHSFIHHADVCINLRFPSPESASWSLVEQFYFKKTVIASKVGFYDEIPSNCLTKISISNERKELLSALERLIKDKPLRDRMAEQAHQYALRHFSSDDYAEKMIDFTGKVISSRINLDFIDNATDEIIRFSTPSLSERVAVKIADEISCFI